MKTRHAAVAGIVVIAVGLWWWWDSPERQVRRALSEIADLLSADGRGAGLAQASGVARLHGYLAEDVVLEPGHPIEPLVGRDALMAAVVQLRTRARAVQVSFADVRIAMSDGGQTAAVEANVTVSTEDARGARQVDGREVVIGMTRQDNRWMVRSARVVPAIRPL
jgi:hypothetical protein